MKIPKGKMIYRHAGRVKDSFFFNGEDERLIWKSIKKGGNMRKYVISSSEFECKDEAMAQIAEWAEGGTLDSKARVYEVKRKYQPVLSKSVDVELMEVEK